jgi:hypothetical protein
MFHKEAARLQPGFKESTHSTQFGHSPDGSLDYPDDVLARLAGPKLIRTKVMPTAPRAPAVIAPQWTPEAELSTEGSGTRTAGFVAICASFLLASANGLFNQFGPETSSQGCMSLWQCLGPSSMAN